MKLGQVAPLGRATSWVLPFVYSPDFARVFCAAPAIRPAARSGGWRASPGWRRGPSQILRFQNPTKNSAAPAGIAPAARRCSRRSAYAALTERRSPSAERMVFVAAEHAARAKLHSGPAQGRAVDDPLQGLGGRVDASWIALPLLALLRFSSGLFRAMFAMKEIGNGNEIHRPVFSLVKTDSNSVSVSSPLHSARYLSYQTA